MLRLVVGLLLVAAAQVRACLLGDLCADVRRPLPAASKPAAKCVSCAAETGEKKKQEAEKRPACERARVKLNPKP